MPKKPAPKRKPKQDDPKQSKRFVKMAREIGTDERPEAFEKAFTKVAPKRSK
jgi:hypothetical protein